MQTIESLILSGRIVDVMLVLVALEIAVIAAIQLRRRERVAGLPLVANVGAGASLIVALRFALTDGSWQWIALSLFAALLFHALDTALRWQSLVAPGTR